MTREQPVKVFIDDILILNNIKSEDLNFNILNFLSQFLYTIERNVPTPKDIKFICRENLQDYMDPSDNDSKIPLNKKPLTKVRAQRIFEANSEICFGFGKDFKKHEFDVINE